MTEPTTLATGLKFPEGPIAMPDGSVILVEIAAGVLTRIGPDGTREVIAEPGGGAHLDPESTCLAVGEAIGRHLDDLSGFSGDELVTKRREKYYAMGRWEEISSG